MTELTAALRADEVREGIKALRIAIDQWHHATSKVGFPGQYATQLDGVKYVLLGALAGISERFEKPDAGEEPGGLWTRARTAETSAGFVRRLWRWYADRFAQRGDGAISGALAAADEVVWSSWKQTWDDAGHTKPGAAPLPYIDFGFAANATPRAHPPSEISPPTDDGVLAQWAGTLPIPLIGLPEIVTRRPWWLVVALHETGHHVQYDLDPGLVDATAASVAALIDPNDAQAQLAWKGWSRELFADAFSVVFGGRAAMWAVIESERAPAANLVRSPNARYPAPVVRIAVMREVARAVGEQVPDDPYPDADRTKVEADLLRARDVAAALLNVPLGATTLCKLAADRVVRGQRAEAWRKWLAAEAQPVADEQLTGARDVVCGSVLAWIDAAQADPPRDHSRLRERTLSLISASREDKVRAIAPAPQAADLNPLLDWLHAPGAAEDGLLATTTIASP